MKLRVGACALMLVLAGCSGESPESGMAGMRGVAASKPTNGLPTALPLARAIGASIANAPDRGALMSYPNKAVPAKQEGAYTWFPTAISEAHAYKGIATGEMTVPSPDGSQVKLRYERHVEEIDGNWTWIGRVIGGDPMQEAIITFGEKAVFGSIPQSNGKPALSLQTRNGSVFAVQTDPSKVVSATKGHVDVMIPEAATLRSSMAAAVSQSAQVNQGATAVAQAAPPTGANTIDVAIGYTPEFAAANNGASGAATRLVYLIQVGNQAFSNSDINGYLRIVNALQVNYTNTNTNQTALQELTGSTGNSPVTIPASLAPLRAARDQYGADIAVLVRKFSTPENAGCGIAWLNGANGPSRPGQAPITAADAAWGYAVISDGYDDGTDGKTYYCADETLVHEAAHLMGSAHDRANSMNGASLQYGAYSYSFGYKTSAAAGNFYTVMAYGDTGQTAHRIFSTPLKSTCGSAGNLVCGVANSEDNARSLNQTIPVVAAFRSTVVPFTSAVPNDFDGDKKSEVYWRNTSTGVNDLWVMNGTALSAAYPVHYEPNQAWVVVGTGDFNGDGKADVLWRNSTSGQVYIHFMNGINVLPTSGNSLLVADQNWQIAAIADFDGDGLSDIYWRNAATGVNSLWLMNGLTPKSNTVVYTEANLAWKIVGAGDFDGDGFADLFWRNTSTGENYVLFMKGTAVQSKSGLSDRVSEQAFQVVAIRDFNNDGKADLYWRNTTTGQNWMWTMDGVKPSRVTYVHYEPNQAWKVVNSGDYNGDGNMDLFWRNSSTGQTYVHLMQNTTILGTSGLSAAVPNMAWQVVGR